MSNEYEDDHDELHSICDGCGDLCNESELTETEEGLLCPVCLATLEEDGLEP